MASTPDILQELLELSHRLGQEERSLAILGEGNTSARLTEETFFVKASGSNLRTLSAGDVVECRFEPLLELFSNPPEDDLAIDRTLMASRVSDAAKKPSVEALFHAYFLTLPGVNFVGHVHPVSANAILCSPLATRFADHRLFPDEIVCCGERSVYVPYTDPGLPLAIAIRTEVEKFREETGQPPRIVLMGNHGVVALGATVNAVEAAMLMCEKAARIFLGAATLGGPVFLEPEQVRRISGRSDEHYRRKMLNL